MPSSFEHFEQSAAEPEQTGAAGRTGYLFGSFELDLQTGSLYQGEQEVELRPKNFELLLYLIRNPGRLIAKSECLNRIWPDTSVTENVLTQGIAEIRKVLADDPHTPSFIKTVPRRGYMFVSEVTPIGQNQSRDRIPKSYLAAIAASRWRPAGTAWILTAILMGVFLGGGLVWLMDGFPQAWFSQAAVHPSAAHSGLAVIPFKVESDIEGYEWLGRGIADMVSSSLASIPDLRVLSHERLEDADGGKAVTGTLTKHGGGVDIEAQLIDVTTGEVESRASIRIDSLDHVLEGVEEICLRIFQTVLRRKSEMEHLSGWHEAEVTTGSLDAYRHYVAALTKFQYGGKLGSDAALLELEKSIRIDPAFAMAHFKIAELKQWRETWGYSRESPREAVLEAAKYASELPEKERLLIEGLKALTVDEDALTALGIWQQLEKLYRQYALDVGLPVRIVEIYLAWGNLDEAIAYGESFVNQSGLGAADRARLNHHVSAAYSQQGDLVKALSYAKRSLAIWPLKDSPAIVLYLVRLGRSELFAGNHMEALKHFDRARSLAGEDAVYLTNTAWGYYFAGDAEEALLLTRLALSSNPEYGDAYHLQGWIHLSQGRHQLAAAELEKAYEKTPARFGSAFHQIIGGDLAALYYAGVAYAKSQQRQKAASVFLKLLKECERVRLTLPEDKMSRLAGTHLTFLEALARLRLSPEKEADRHESAFQDYNGFFKQMARLCALRGDRQEALNWLEKAIEGGDRSYQHIYDTPDFEELRDLPRFYQLITSRLFGGGPDR